MREKFMEIIADPQWLLVIITAVYAVFTIKIFQENRKSSSALKLQIDESARQYEEKKRLEMRPYFNIEIDEYDPKDSWNFQLRLTSGSNFSSEIIRFNITNIGLGTAKEIKFCLITIPECPDPIWKALDTTALLSGKSFVVRVSFLVEKELVQRTFQKKAFMQIQYEDLLDNKYMAVITLDFIGSELSFHIQKYGVQQGLITTTEKKHA